MARKQLGTAPSGETDAATKKYVDDEVSEGIDTRQPKFMTGTSSTAVGTAAKTVTLDSPWSSYTPQAGDLFLVKFTNGNSANSPTLSINGGSAVAIKTPAGNVGYQSTSVAAGATVLLYYDGTSIYMMGATANSSYSEIAEADVTNPAGTTAGLITGRRMATAIANKAKGRSVAAQGYTGGPTTVEYRLLGTLPVDNTGNNASMLIDGRIGGWTSGMLANWSILLANRTSSLTGDTVTAAVFATGAVQSALSWMDIVVYAQPDKSAKVYLKLTAYYSYDFNVSVVQSTVDYTGASLGSTEPDGTLIWSLSTAPRSEVDQAGRMTVSAVGTTNGSVVSVDGAQTLTNKTLTNPRIGQINDNNGNAMVTFTTATSAVNYIRIGNNATGTSPYVRAIGGDTNVNLLLTSHGNGTVRLQDGNWITGFEAAGVASGVNWIRATGSTTGNGPILQAVGSDTNINFILMPKGSGRVGIRDAADTSKVAMFDTSQIASGQVRTWAFPNVSSTFVGTDATQTLTNKTLTSPIISMIRASNGTNAFATSGVTDGANYITAVNSVSGSVPYFLSTGNDANIHLGLVPKGSGNVQIYGTTGQTPTIQATGQDTNVDLDLLSKGTGQVKANGSRVITLTDVVDEDDMASDSATKVPTQQSVKSYVDSGLSGKQNTLGFTPENTANKGQANGYASLDGGGKVPVTQLPNSIMEYKGTWNASTNTPTLADGNGNTGDVYRVSTGGTQNLGSGSITFNIGDYVIYNGSTWERSGGTDGVASVAGLTGVISASSLTDALTDGTTNKVFTAAEKTKLAGVETGATANSADATLLNRANHTGTQSADTIVDGTTNKAFTATEKTKLAGIAAGATANDTDANLKNRANHTGTQAISTVTGLQTALDGKQSRFMTGTITTAAGTSAKTVTLDAPWDSAVVAAGDILLLTFGFGNSASSLSLAVNGGLGYPIRTPSGATSSAALTVGANIALLLYFDGDTFTTLGATNNTTYSTITNDEIVNTGQTTARLITGQRAEYLLNNEASKTRTLTNKTISGADNTLTDIPQSAVTNLTTDLASKVPSTSTPLRAYITNELGANIVIPIANVATGTSVVVRDNNGRTQFATPSADADAATKGYVDSKAPHVGTTPPVDTTRLWVDTN